MYKCKDCNTEYNIKPDYCDCGSNDFEDTIQTFEENVSYVAPVKLLREYTPQEITSYVIFILCLIFAIIPWFIKAAPNNSTAVSPVKMVQNKKNIPDINSIWKNTPSVPSSAPVSAESPQNQASILPPVTQVAPIQTSVPPKTVKTISKPVPKSTSQLAPQKNQANPQTSALDKKEMYNYKRALAGALISRLNIPVIEGGGDCVIQFSVDSNGKLLNRGFVSQSDNKSMNDQIYYMLMRLPNFKSPPSGYNGQKFKLKFTVNNGDYNVTFVN